MEVEKVADFSGLDERKESEGPKGVINHPAGMIGRATRN